MKALMSLEEAASETPFSVKTLRRAVRATQPDEFPPPLRAKAASRGAYVIRDVDLREWIDSLPDA